MKNFDFLIDGFPFDLTQVEVLEEDCEPWEQGAWGGPITPETEAARLQGIQAAWDADPALHEGARERMRAGRANGTITGSRPHLGGMSDLHRRHLAEAKLGNQNSRKHPKEEQEARRAKIDPVRSARAKMAWETRRSRAR